MQLRCSLISKFVDASQVNSTLDSYLTTNRLPQFSPSQALEGEERFFQLTQQEQSLGLISTGRVGVEGKAKEVDAAARKASVIGAKFISVASAAQSGVGGSNNMRSYENNDDNRETRTRIEICFTLRDVTQTSPLQ